MSNELTVSNGQPRALALGQDHLNAEQVELLKRTVCRGATDDEFQLFLYQCNRTKLDPFVKQIHAVKRWDTKTEREVMSIQTGIDGYRLIADRTGKYEGQTLPQWCGEDGVWRDVWLEDHAPKAARIGVWKTGFREPAYGVALWKEYIQTYSFKGQIKVAPMWIKMGVNQIAKCAEALALRKAFPQELSGIHTDEEMAQVNTNASMMDVPAAALTAAPEPLDDEERKERKKARAQLNKALQEAVDAKTFAVARGVFQKEHGKEIWEQKTHHNDRETFMDLVHEHWSRIDAEIRMAADLVKDKADFLERLSGCADPESFLKLEKESEETFRFKDDMEIQDAVKDKGRDLGFTYAPDFLAEEA